MLLGWKYIRKDPEIVYVMGLTGLLCVYDTIDFVVFLVVSMLIVVLYSSRKSRVIEPICVSMQMIKCVSIVTPCLPSSRPVWGDWTYLELLFVFTPSMSIPVTWIRRRPNHSHTLPHDCDLLVGSGSMDILSQEGFAKMQEIVGDILASPVVL